MQFKDNSVLITGGASGIGKIMARLLLEHGAKVIIWDIDESKTTAVISELSALGVIVGYTVDISSKKQIKDTAKKVKQTFGGIDILINNAGIIIGDYFHQHNTSNILKMMDVNGLRDPTRAPAPPRCSPALCERPCPNGCAWW